MSQAPNRPVSAPLVAPVSEKSWVESLLYTPPGENQQTVRVLNFTSYAAINLSGAVSWATELISAKDPSLKKGGHLILPLAQTLVQIEIMAFRRLGIMVYDPQEGLATRARGMLRTRIEACPVPFGAPVQTWESWVEMLSSDVANMLSTVAILWANGTGATPWEALAKTEPQPGQASASLSPEPQQSPTEPPSDQPLATEQSA